MTIGQQRRYNMPSKKQIAMHWGITDYDDCCMGCGVHPAKIHRAHILSVVYCKDNSCDNLLLLCTFCHNEIQEVTASNREHSDKIKQLFKDEHLPFLNIRIAFSLEKYKLLSKLSILNIKQ